VLLATLARTAPAGTAEALGLDLDPATTHFVGMLPNSLVMVDEADHKERVSLSVGAVPERTTGVLVSAFPPVRARRPLKRMSWGDLADTLSSRGWPAPVHEHAEALARLAKDVQSTLDEARCTKAEITVEELTRPVGALPGEARLAAAVLSRLVAEVTERPAPKIIDGPSHRPIVRLSFPLGRALSAVADVGAGPAGAQVSLLIVNNEISGPTWRHRYRNPGRYTAALSKVVPEAMTHLAPEGWLARGASVLAVRGWQFVEGKPDSLLTNLAGLSTTPLLLRPPSAAGTLWLVPKEADLALLIGTMAELARVMRSTTY